MCSVVCSIVARARYFSGVNKQTSSVPGGSLLYGAVVSVCQWGALSVGHARGKMEANVAQLIIARREIERER